jgi:hypothetical protein
MWMEREREIERSERGRKRGVYYRRGRLGIGGDLEERAER